MLFKNMTIQKITAMEQQKRNPHRVNVYLDGEFALGLSRFVAAWLQVGQEIDNEKITALQAKDEREVAYQRAIKFISYRIRSEKEIQRRLKKLGFSEDVIAEVTERLSQNNLVDDEHFAKAWVENRNEFRPRSHRMLAMEMRQKGISEEVITQTLEKTDEDEDLAYRAASKQSRKYKDLEWPEFRRKLTGFLARRGFSYEIISPVVGQVWAEHSSHNPTGSNITEEEVIS